MKNVRGTNILNETGSVYAPVEQSPYHKVEPLKWTQGASDEGILPQEGMIVRVEVFQYNYKGEGVLQHYGKNIVVVEIDGVEEVFGKDCIKPFEVEKSYDDEQRDKVVKLLNEFYGFGVVYAEDCYKDLQRLGVIKEDK